MKPQLSLLAALSLAAFAPAAFAQTKAPEAPKDATPREVPGTPVGEADYAKTLLGSWRQEMKEGPMTGHAITTYLEGGKATSVGNFEAGGQKIEIKAKAKWTLEGNKITIEITESSMPDAMPVGAKMTQTILSLSDKEFRYNQDGQEITETRVKEEKKGADEKPGK